MLSGYKLVARRGPHVFDVVDEKGVREGLLDQQDNLSTARGKSLDYFSAYARRAALYIALAQSRRLSNRAYGLP